MSAFSWIYYVVTYLWFLEFWENKYQIAMIIRLSEIFSHEFKSQNLQNLTIQGYDLKHEQL